MANAHRDALHEHVKHARKKYVDVHREHVRQSMRSNREQLEQALKRTWEEAITRPPLVMPNHVLRSPREDEEKDKAMPRAKKHAVVKRNRGGTMRVVAHPLDPVQPPPKYVTWRYATSNVRDDSEVGRKLLYEVGGETLHASDSDGSDDGERHRPTNDPHGLDEDEEVEDVSSFDGRRPTDNTPIGSQSEGLQSTKRRPGWENAKKSPRNHPEQHRSTSDSLNNSDSEPEPYWQPIDDYVIQSTAQVFDTREPQVIQSLADYAETTPEMIQRRILCLEKGIDSIQGLWCQAALPKMNNLEEAMDTHRTLFCRRCRVFDCKRQCFGYTPPPKPEVLWPRAKTGMEERQSPCMRDCWKEEPPASRLRRSTPQNEWGMLEEGIIKMGRKMFGSNACLIAKLLPGHRCKAVKQWLDQHAEEDTIRHESGNTEPVKNHKNRSGKKKKSRSSITPAALAVRKQIEKSGRAVLPAYKPCSCSGNCVFDTCTCAQNGNFCEKFCQCSQSCPHRFQGCRCKKGQCRTKACPCFAAGRECDPDLCHNCIPSIPAHGNRGAARGGGGSDGTNQPQCCQNMNLLLRRHRHVQMGISEIHGWGAFLKGDAEKNSFLGEYTGELISHEEADRRGKVYDLVNSSYLFNLNSEFVVDAFLRGNKFRFANHSPNPNCYAKVLLVEGEHRVGIFAKERIKDGEELFYDYRYDKEKEAAMVQKAQRKNP
eukprot:CAMPEP_0183829392 /NCGR_PEP_ID=MMETSP0807_2-20130328/3279_1 /TAXON_ID=88271 /ORGANISM="Picocystis salinarum, Strain CCMP1897" /LENGTH=709 /DNA_ID=CAMNT_0026074599 /DNA_START=120 /DNA_END=2249 /DNA_ORIENTATION=+